MKSSIWFSILCAATLLSGTALQAQAPSIIESRGERRQGPPLWISAEAVADEEKIIDLDLVDYSALSRRVEKQRQALGSRVSDEKYRVGGKPIITAIPRYECKSMSYQEDGRGGGGPRFTLKALAEGSGSILRGTIRSVDLGFGFGSPTSLLGVEVTETIKGAAPSSPFYLNYPVAHFRIGPFQFCNATQGFDPLPGDEILLFDFKGPVDRDSILYAPRHDELFFQRQGGPLILPSHLNNSSGLERVSTLDDVIARLRSGSGLNARRGDR